MKFKDVRPELVPYLVNSSDENRKASEFNKTKVKIRCPFCSAINERQVNSYIKSGLDEKTCIECRSLRKRRPDLLIYLSNKEDELLSFQSNKKITTKCPNCNKEKEITVNNLSNQGFSCELCSDGFSIPEKLMREILKEKTISFKKEYIPSWSFGRRYDFLLEKENIIIELHGEQHYQQSNRGKRDLEEEQINDEYKKQLAIENNIEKYIVIDCRRSEKDFLIKNIKTELSELIDFENVDFDKIWINIQKPISFQVYEDYLNGMKIAEIKNKYNIGKTTIYRYINKFK